MITLLDQSTINKIAAGEVIERPSAVVKELVENAIDAGANGITVEIKEGGISFVRVTDNGGGIAFSEITLAFKRHSTSKIKSVEDLMTVKSLGFRGEALASIAAVSKTELVTKTAGSLTGSRYLIEGGEEKELEEIGCPEGTTFIVRNLFYNTPARRKFLKSAMTEAGYVGDLIERLAISHPHISFKFINNNQVKLQTSGNRNLKDIIYHVYGREIAGHTIAIEKDNAGIKISGFIGKPLVSRGNRNYMNYFINGRYIKSNIINRAIEEAYKPYSMTHRYPFTVLSFEMDSSLIDVNVHPTKMEVRFSNQEEVFHAAYEAISEGLREREMIPPVTLEGQKKEKTPVNNRAVQSGTAMGSVFVKAAPEKGPEPFERRRLDAVRQVEETLKSVRAASEGNGRENDIVGTKIINHAAAGVPVSQKAEQEQPQMGEPSEKAQAQEKLLREEAAVYESGKQLDLFAANREAAETAFLSEENVKKHRIIGQLFLTYWLVELEDKLFMIDQHAAHEKVLFERTMETLRHREFTSQMINPPIVLTLSMREEETLKNNMEIFNRLGFEIEPFGGKEYSVRAVPADLFSIAQKELLIELLDDLVAEDGKQKPDLLLEKVASLSCKAAVKGNMRLSEAEAHELIHELMALENPYHCPHGRPTIISMSKYEIEKKFKRIV